MEDAAPAGEGVHFWAGWVDCGALGTGVTESGRYKLPFLPQPASANKVQINKKIRMGSL